MDIKVNSLQKLIIQLGIMAGILLILILFFFYGCLPSTTNHGKTITVPDVIGMHIDQLEEFISKRDLRYSVNEDSAYFHDKPSFTVLKQYPKAGSRVK